MSCVGRRDAYLRAMRIAVKQPVVVGVPLDDTTQDVVAAAAALAQRLETTLVPVHALPPWPFPTARRTWPEAEQAITELRRHLAPIATAGLGVTEPIVRESEPGACVLDVAAEVHAQMVVVGEGTGPTVAKWVLGTVADRVVRAARCPVFIARGTMPSADRPIVCPIDLSPHSLVGFEAALRMARRFEAPLRVVTVLPSTGLWQGIDALALEAEGLETATRRELEKLTREHDTKGVALDVRLRAGDPTDVILEEAGLGGLVVLASRAFDMLVPFSLGNVTSRVLRRTRSSVLAVRDLDEAPERREKRFERVKTLRSDAMKTASSGDLETAERSLRMAAALRPGNAAIEDDLASVIERLGRKDEADRTRALAEILRSWHA